MDIDESDQDYYELVYVIVLDSESSQVRYRHEKTYLYNARGGNPNLLIRTHLKRLDQNYSFGERALSLILINNG